MLLGTIVITILIIIAIIIVRGAFYECTVLLVFTFFFFFRGGCSRFPRRVSRAFSFSLSLMVLGGFICCWCK